MVEAAVEVMYARVPPELKRAVEGYASAQGMTLTAAVVDLLERGLEATKTMESSSALEQRIADLEHQLADRNAELTGAHVRLGGIEERERSLQALAQRSTQTLGKCPKCAQPIRGYDLLATGTCPNCRYGVAGLITSPDKAGLDRTEMLVLIAALGLILGATYLATKNA